MHEIDLGKQHSTKHYEGKHFFLGTNLRDPSILIPRSPIKLLASKQEQQFWLQTSVDKPKCFSNAGLRLNPCNIAKHLQAREHFKHETRHTKEKSIFSIVGRRRRLKNHFWTRLLSSIKAPSWKTKQSYILTSSETRILREDSKR